MMGLVLALKYLSFLLAVLVAWYLPTSSGYMVKNNPFHRVETLDPRGKFELEWLVDWKLRKVTFNCTVETKGYIGLGLSLSGKSSGADIIIGGIEANGKAYFSDRFAKGNQIPILDSSQDWTLNLAWESATHTFLSFSRPFDTCDVREDFPITEDKISLIWAYGENDDNVTYHYQNRGVYEVYLLHPDYTPRLSRDLAQGYTEVLDDAKSDVKVWNVEIRSVMPSARASYICTIYKAPRLTKKHHVVGTEVYFGTGDSAQFVYRVQLYRCHAPSGVDPNVVFEPLLEHDGQICFNPFKPTGSIPTHRCTELFQTWASGSRPFFYPENVGVPIGLAQDEYFMLQIHYDNVNEVSNKVVDVQMDLFYTSKLRAHEGGMLVLGHEIPGRTPSLLIPPSSIDQIIYGHCSSSCTKQMFPTDGINIFGILPFAHNSGRQIRLQQFRKNQELPWISSDDNFNFKFQQARALRNEIKVLPGDQLILKCTYDNTWTNGTVTGGYSSRQEMCLAFVYYYNKLDGYASCTGQPDTDASEEYRRHVLGISDIVWDDSKQEFVVVTPGALKGLTVSQVSDSHVPWNIRLRSELHKFQQFHPQSVVCRKELYALDLPSLVGRNSTGFGPLSTFPVDAFQHVPPSTTSCKKSKS